MPFRKLGVKSLKVALALLVLVVTGALLNTGIAAAAITVETLGPGEARPTSMQFQGSANPGGNPAEVDFEYAAIGSASVVSTPFQPAGNGTKKIYFHESITGLEPGVRYQCRAVIKIGKFLTYGSWIIASTATNTPVYTGSYDSDPQLIRPVASTVDSNGDVWVVSEGAEPSFHPEESQVIEFGPNHATLAVFGLGALLYPSGIAVDSSGNVWVADGGHRRVVKFSPTGTVLGTFSGAPLHEFIYPTGIAAAPGGGVWVVDHRDEEESGSIGSLQKLSPAGQVEESIELTTEKFGIHGVLTGFTLGPEGTFWISTENSESGTVVLAGVDANGNHRFFASSTIYPQMHCAGPVATTPDGHVLVVESCRNSVKEFDSNGTPEGQFSSEFGYQLSTEEHLSFQPGSIAVGSDGSIWIGDSGQRRISKWITTAPGASTEAASAINSSGGTINGTVRPEGATTSYYFEYGTGGNLSNMAPATPTSVGSGTAPVPVSQTLTGLAPGTIEGYRLVAVGVNGKKIGATRTFQVPAPPGAVSGAPTEVKGTSAKLNGVVRPEGSETTWYFEFGETINYNNGAKVPVTPQSAGSGSAAVPVSISVPLHGSSTYHYRLVAINSLGTSYGADQTFVSLPALSTPSISATEIKPEAVTMKGEVVPAGRSASWWVEYQQVTTVSPSSGTWVAGPSHSAGSGTTAVPVSQALTGLQEYTQYRYRLIISDSVETVTSAMGTFSTTTNFRAVTYGARSTGATSALVQGFVGIGGGSGEYFFEYGPTTAYGSKAPAAGHAVGVGGEFGETLSGLTAGTIYHYRVVVVSEGKTAYGADRSFRAEASTMATRLSSLAIGEPFDGSTASTERFASRWGSLGWATAIPAKGVDSTTGWHSEGTGLAGAYLNQALEPSASGLAVEATLASRLGCIGCHLSLWLDMPTPSGVEAGYELRITKVPMLELNEYELALYRWQAGTGTELATRRKVTIAAGSPIAFADEGGALTAWFKSGTEWYEAVAGFDGTFTSGYAGLEASDPSAAVTNFGAAQVP